MAGMGEMPMRPQLGPPTQHRGPPPKPRTRLEPIDRKKTCPLLLRVFTKVGGHHQNEEFAVRGKEPKDEVQIYTWKDATLRELTNLVKEVARIRCHAVPVLSISYYVSGSMIWRWIRLFVPEDAAAAAAL